MRVSFGLSPLHNSLCSFFACRVNVSGRHNLPKGTALSKCLAKFIYKYRYYKNVVRKSIDPSKSEFEQVSIIQKVS